MGATRFRFAHDASPEGEAAAEAWRVAGGNPPPAAVERLVEIKYDKVYDRSGIFRLQLDRPAGKTVVAKSGPSKRLSVEALVYRDVLPQLGVTAPDYYGYVENGGQGWLFIEEIVGEPFAPDTLADRELAVQWLAALHSGSSRLDLGATLPSEGPPDYFECIGSASGAILSAMHAVPSSAAPMLDDLVKTLQSLADRWPEVCRRCVSLPHCLVHADFVNKNVVISHRRGRRELFALDWGIAGWGVPAPDLEYLDASNYFHLVRGAWPNVALVDIRFLKTTGIVMRHLGLAHVAAAWLQREPAWALPRLADSAAQLAAASAEL